MKTKLVPGLNSEKGDADLFGFEPDLRLAAKQEQLKIHVTVIEVNIVQVA